MEAFDLTIMADIFACVLVLSLISMFKQDKLARLILSRVKSLVH
jgi:hypothetical protein